LTSANHDNSYRLGRQFGYESTGRDIEIKNKLIDLLATGEVDDEITFVSYH